MYDLLGDIYRVGIEGGKAVHVTQGQSWDWMPRYSPDGRWIAFMSDRSGAYNLWIIQRDGSNLFQVTETWEGEIGPPSWDAQGALQIPLKATLSKIALHSGSEAKRILQLPAGGSIQVHPTEQLYMTRQTGELHPRWSIDRRWKAWARRSGEGWQLVARRSSDGAQVELLNGLSQSGSLSFEDQVPSFAFTSDANSIVLWQDGKLKRIRLSDGQQSSIPVETEVTMEMGIPVHRPMRVIQDGLLESRVVRWPSLDVARNSLVSSVFGKLYETNLETGSSARVTNGNQFEFAPVVSPNGNLVAYASWDDEKLGDIVVRDLATGSEYRVTGKRGRYTNPVWSPDSTAIAYVDVGLDQDLSGRTDLLHVFIVNLNNLANPRSVISLSSPVNGGERAYPVLTFTSDGSAVFVPGGPSDDAPGLRGSHFLYLANASGVSVLGEFPHSDEAVVSPDGTKLLTVRNGRIHLESVMVRREGPLRRLSEFPSDIEAQFQPVHVKWIGNDDISWAESHDVYRANLTSGIKQRVGRVVVLKPRRSVKGSVAILNARIITMRDDEVIERGSIVVRDGRISYIGPKTNPELPAGTVIVDGTGKTVIPGLMDVHAHVFNNSPREIWQRQSHRYVASLAYGVTTLFDPATPTLLDPIGQSEMIDIGEIVGPRLFTSGPALMGEGNRSQARSIKNYCDASILVRGRTPSLLGPLKEYGFPDRQQRRWFVGAARRSGFPVTAEGRDRVTNLSIISDGYTAIEHPIDVQPVEDDVLKFIVSSQVNYTPILVSEGNGLPDYFLRHMSLSEDDKFRRFTPPRYLRRANQSRALSADELKTYERGFEKDAHEAAQILVRGGLVSTGTHGVAWKGTHLEMRALVLGGASSLEALRASTINAAKKLDIDTDVGSIEKGKIADLVVLSANPLDDITNTESIEKVFKGGVIFDSESMSEIWPEFHPLRPWPWQTPAESDQFKAPTPRPLPREQRDSRTTRTH